MQEKNRSVQQKYFNIQQKLDEVTQENITLQDCLAEEKKLEQIRLKLRLSNCLIKATQIFQQGQFSITEKLLNDNLTFLESIEIKDEYLVDKFNQMTTLLNKANFELSLIEIKIQSDKEATENLTSLDTLFDQKQK